MAHSTGTTTPATIPHTNAEQSRMRALYDHVGTPAAPACHTCVGVDWTTCKTGMRLRSAVRTATLARIPAGARL